MSTICKRCPETSLEKHFFERDLKEDPAKCIQKVIHNNAYFFHPENLLLVMLCDERQKIRKLAVFRIIFARKSTEKSILRKFEVPSLNFDAKDYTELIDWKKCKISKPPLTRSMMIENLTEFTTKDVTRLISKDIFHLPCHTQAVERCAKEVTSASRKAYCSDIRDGIIRLRFKSRKSLLIFETNIDLVSKYK